MNPQSTLGNCRLFTLITGVAAPLLLVPVMAVKMLLETGPSVEGLEAGGAGVTVAGQVNLCVSLQVELGARSLATFQTRPGTVHLHRHGLQLVLQLVVDLRTRLEVEHLRNTVLVRGDHCALFLDPHIPTFVEAEREWLDFSGGGVFVLESLEGLEASLISGVVSLDGSVAGRQGHVGVLLPHVSPQVPFGAGDVVAVVT